MIYSLYYQKEINLSTSTAKGTGKRTLVIVPHSELEHFILNKVKSVHYEFTSIIPGLDDAVVVCTIWDENGRKIVLID